MKTANLHRLIAEIKTKQAVTGDVPSVAELAESMGFTVPDVQDAIRRLKTQGVLTEYNGRLYLRGDAPEPEAAPKETIRRAPNREYTGDSTGLAQLREVGVPVIRITMVLVAIVAVGISIHFSRLWLLSFLGATGAASLAAVMVLYATVAPQIIGVVMVRVSVIRVLASVVIGATALLVMVFSMVSTVAGQYAGFQQTEATGANENRQEIAAAATWDLLQSQAEGLRERIADKQEEIDAVQVLLKEFDTLEKRTEKWTFYLTTTSDLERMGGDMDRLQADLREVQSEIRSAIDSGSASIVVTDSRETFYDWAGGLLLIASDRVQFWLSMFPAVFVDIIAPLALAIAIFLRKREKIS